MLITKTIEIDMGHRVPNHKSKCRNFHGHRYKIEVGVDDKLVTVQGDSSEGMVIDYSDLKQVMMEELDAKFDHGFVMYEHDIFRENFEKMRDLGNLKIIFVEFIPTCENLVMFWFDIMRRRLLQKGIMIHHVKVWETPNSTAEYSMKLFGVE